MEHSRACNADFILKTNLPSCYLYHFSLPSGPSLGKGLVQNCQVLRNQELMYQNFNMYMLSNHNQNVQSKFRLFKVCVCVKLESSNGRKLLFNFRKARLIKNQTRLIEARADCFSTKFSNSAQARFDVQGFMFYPKYKNKNPSHVLKVVDMLCV